MKYLGNKGESYILTCVIVLTVSMLLSVVLFYVKTITIIDTTKDNTERVLDSFVMHNSKEIYRSIKQGNDFTDTFDETFYINQTALELTMDNSNELLYCIDDKGTVLYTLTIPSVSFSVENELKLKAEYTIVIPIHFAGKELSKMSIPITINSHYTLKG